jgi:hypothetical protein
MTKKEFKELASIHKYGRGRNPNNLTAIFFEWRSNDEGNGFKYCIFARNCNAKTDELMNMLYDFINGRIEDVPWYVQLTVAMSDKQRFKVPLDSGGLNRMIKYEPQPATV